jgi:hypothetical protein
MNIDTYLYTHVYRTLDDDCSRPSPNQHGFEEYISGIIRLCIHKYILMNVYVNMLIYIFVVEMCIHTCGSFICIYVYMNVVDPHQINMDLKSTYQVLGAYMYIYANTHLYTHINYLHTRLYRYTYIKIFLYIFFNFH